MVSIRTADPAVAAIAVTVTTRRFLFIVTKLWKKANGVGVFRKRLLAILFVVLFVVPHLKRISVKVFLAIRATVIVAKPRHAIIGREKREGDRVVHALTVAG